MTQDDQVTATRHTLSEEWKAMRGKIDWMHAPGMPDYVNSLVSGKPISQDGHWSRYALREHIQPLLDKRDGEAGMFRKGKLSMLTLGCGSAHIEARLIGHYKWPISQIVGLEYDQSLRKHAATAFAEQCPSIDAKFLPFDFNNPTPLAEKFDIVYCCHAIHHATDLEAFLPEINRYLKDDGLFIGIDFFGPTRFQIEYDVQPIIEELFEALPESFRRDLRFDHGPVAERFDVATIKDVRDADISESVRSSDLRTLLFSNFPVADIKPMGGTLLRWLLQYRAGNFFPDNPDHVAMIRLLQIIEREMISSKRIRSDDLFFVLKKSNRI